MLIVREQANGYKLITNIKLECVLNIALYVNTGQMGPFICTIVDEPVSPCKW